MEGSVGIIVAGVSIFVFVSLLFLTLKIIFKIENIVKYYLSSLSFSFLGLTIGYFIGLSQSPVVGIVIPALFSFLSGLLAYTYIQKSNSFDNNTIKFVSTIIIFLTVSMVISEEIGTMNRMISTYYEKEILFERELFIKHFEHLQTIDEKIFDLDTVRFFRYSKRPYEIVRPANGDSVSLQELEEYFETQ